jgi:transposase InsO family protein
VEGVVMPVQLEGLVAVLWNEASFGQRCRVHRDQSHALAARSGDRTGLHRAGQSWQNGVVESINGKLRDELLNREWQPRGSSHADRAMAAVLQRTTTAQRAPLSTTGTRAQRVARTG